MDTELPAALRQAIDAAIAGGFDSPEEIAETLPERFEGDDEVDLAGVTPESLRAAVAASLAAHLEAQASWPVPTDCDRLDRAFARLERIGVVARQNWTCCQNCGHGEIGEELEAARAGGRAVRGYTFFHQQDAERAVEGAGVYLAYGLPDQGGAAELEALGGAIRDALEAEGLEVHWNGSSAQRLHVSLDWKKRR